MEFKYEGLGIEFPDLIIPYNDIIKRYKDLGHKKKKEFMDRIKEIQNANDFNSLVPLIADELLMQIVEDTIAEMIQNGIYTCTADLFKEKYYDYYDFTPCFEEWRTMFDDIDREDQEYYRALQRKQQSRGYWEGGGFGLSGAIKGHLTASALNLGSDMIHGIGDGITAARHHNKIEKKKQKLLEQSSIIEQLGEDFQYCCSDIAEGLLEEYKAKGLIKIPEYEEDEADAIFCNAEKYVENEKQKIQMYIESIKKFPYDVRVYLNWGELLLKSNKMCAYRELTAIADFFGYAGEMSYGFTENIAKHVNSIKKNLSEESQGDSRLLHRYKYIRDGWDKILKDRELLNEELVWMEDSFPLLNTERIKNAYLSVIESEKELLKVGEITCDSVDEAIFITEVLEILKNATHELNEENVHIKKETLFEQLKQKGVLFEKENFFVNYPQYHTEDLVEQLQKLITWMEELEKTVFGIRCTSDEEVNLIKPILNQAKKIEKEATEENAHQLIDHIWEQIENLNEIKENSLLQVQDSLTEVEMELERILSYLETLEKTVNNVVYRNYEDAQLIISLEKEIVLAKENLQESNAHEKKEHLFRFLQQNNMLRKDRECWDRFQGYDTEYIAKNLRNVIADLNLYERMWCGVPFDTYEQRQIFRSDIGKLDEHGVNYHNFKEISKEEEIEKLIKDIQALCESDFWDKIISYLEQKLRKKRATSENIRKVMTIFGVKRKDTECCANCGKKIKQGAKFCVFCGNQINT